MPKATRVALAILVLLVITTGIYWLVAAPGTGAAKSTSQTPATSGTPAGGAAKPTGASKPGAAPKPGGSSDVARGGDSTRPGSSGAPAAAPGRGGERPAITHDGAAGSGRTPAITGSGAAGPVAAPPAGASTDGSRVPTGFTQAPAMGPAPSLDRPPPGFVAAVPPRSTPFDRPEEVGGGATSGSGVSVPAASSTDSAPAPALDRTSTPPPSAATSAPAAKPPAASPSSPGSESGVRAVDYVVKDGDTMVSIAEYWFGDRGRWDLIRAANPDVDPTRLRIGQTLRLPAKDAPRPSAKPVAPGADATHVIVSGDTLYAIARAAYGDGELWTLIHEANKAAIGDDPTELKVGMKLRIPARK